MVVGDAGEERCGDSEAAETGGDVEAGAARARLEGRGPVGRAGGGEVDQCVSGHDDGELLCGFRCGAHAGSTGTAAAWRGPGRFGGAL